MRDAPMRSPFSVIQNVFPLIGRPGVCETDFLYYATNGRQQTEEYKGHHPAWRQSYFAVPGLEVQRRIADIFVGIDELIENNRRRVEVLEEMARAIYRDWFVRFRYPGHEDVPLVDSPLGPIPDGWAVVTLESLGAVTVGGDWGQDEPGDGGWTEAICLRGVDLPRLRLGDIASLRMRWLKETSLSKRELEPGDVVVEGSGECGRSLAYSSRMSSLTKRRMTYSNFCKRIRCKSPSHAVFVARLLNTMVQDGSMVTFKTGTTIPNLNFKALMANHALALPPDGLLRAFAELSQPLEEFTLSGVVGNLVALRTALLPQLVTGELDVSHIDLDALTEAATR